MKRKISFDITIGSHWPDKTNELGFSLPTGGYWETDTFEFETDGKDPMKDAEDELARRMLGKAYHIWYWYWLD